MASETRNYKLTKPDGNEIVNVQILNNNFDKIDEELKKAVNAGYDFENLAHMLGCEYRATFSSNSIHEKIVKEETEIATRITTFLENGNIEVILRAVQFSINSKITYSFSEDSISGRVESI